MLKLIKYFKPFAIYVFIVIALLFGQAMCDLSLPQYMSDIVNVGIQQGGIENAIPKAIRESEFNKLTILMSEDDRNKVKDSYTLINSNSSDYNTYLDEYPELKNQGVYVLKNDLSKEDTDSLNSILGKSILITSNIEKNGLTMPQGAGAQGTQTPATGQTTGQQPANGSSTETPQTAGQTTPAQGTGAQGTAQLPANTDPFTILSKLPQAQIDGILDSLQDKLDGLSDTMITQSAIEYIKNEYKSLGMDTYQIQKSYIFKAGGIMLGIAFLGMIATITVGFLSARIAAGLSRNLRRKVFEKVENFSNVEIDKFSTASLITRTTNDITQIQQVMVMLFRFVFYAPILGIGGVIKVLNTDSSMTWIIALAVGLLMILIAVLFTVALPKFKSVQKLVDKLNLVTREGLSGMLVIRAFNTEKNEKEKFEDANNDFTSTNLFVSRLMVIMMPIMMFIMNGVTLLIVWVGAHQVDKGTMQVGNMMSFLQYAMQIIMAFLMISMVSIMLPRASVSAKRVCEVLDTKVEILDPKNPKEFSSSKKGYVEFKNVYFKYPNAEEYVLEDINFTAKPGETTAFIGSTGSGKSTLINLIPRFYDVTKGEILVDGMDIREVTQKNLRGKIGFVPQKGVLFTGTIESNLKFGDENASEEQIKKSVEIAQSTNFINEKPDKYNTEISQGGTNVSGGQKQRLSIARAIVKKPEVYIFDDSFSALDFKTDKALRAALKVESEKENSTTLLVAQRISTIMHAEQIIVLEEGKIVGMGKHEDLMKTCEVYKEIAYSQLSKEELA